MEIATNFRVHMLTDEGKEKARKIAEYFTTLLSALQELCPGGREMALTVTHLEIACRFAKHAMAQADGNHEKA